METQMIRVVAGLVILLTVITGAYHKGRLDEQKAQLLEIHHLNSQINKAENKRLVYERQLRKLQEELDAKAYEDPLADNPSLGVDSLRRLNQLD